MARRRSPNTLGNRKVFERWWICLPTLVVIRASPPEAPLNRLVHFQIMCGPFTQLYFYPLHLATCFRCLFCSCWYSFSICGVSALPWSPENRFFFPTQLKNYEQAVIEKRFSELEEDEVDALLDEVNEQ